jgi:hypothetical protein
LVGTTADFADFCPRRPLSFNHLVRENREPAGRIGEVRLAAGLAALYPKLDANSGEALDEVVNEVLDETRNTQTFVTYAELSALLAHRLPREQQVARIFQILRHPLIAAESREHVLAIRRPLTAGETTEHLLAVLEGVQGVQVKFGGNLWKAVEWAEAEQKAGRLKGLDLDAAMQTP